MLGKGGGGKVGCKGKTQKKKEETAFQKTPLQTGAGHPYPTMQNQLKREN